MFIQLVMLTSIICLLWGGKRILQKSKTINYSPGKLLAWGLLSIAFSIFSYAIRDVFIQFELYKIQYVLYQIGGTVQAIGILLIFWFVFQEFVPRFFIKIIFPIIIGGIVFMIIAIAFFPTMSIIEEAPLEPVPYKVISHPWQSNAVNIAFFSLIIGFSILIFFIFLYNSIREKEKKGKIKGLLYGLGILLLFLPALLCVFISPIFARIGYTIGAILIYKAFGMKI
ncbi:hypothetical protein KJA15_03895 [Patescibacteria group bacterium]|nr:hypothetical protein [Patescibacteria group bacterium]